MAVTIATVACASTAAPSTPPPPTIDVVGLISGVEETTDSVTYRLADGSSWVGTAGAYRTIRPGSTGGHLLIVGTDAEGLFVATFNTQDGLPADCYVENAEGVDRGAYVEARGILWAKAPQFRSPAQVPSVGQAYPNGTRFCFDASGFVAAVVSP